MDTRAGKRTPFVDEVANHFIDDFTQFAIQSHGIIAMNAGHKIGAFPNIGLVLVTPLNPFMVLVARSHGFTCSIADFTCFSW
jgi:hypothetical protein